VRRPARGGGVRYRSEKMNVVKLGEKKDYKETSALGGWDPKKRESAGRKSLLLGKGIIKYSDKGETNGKK